MTSEPMDTIGKYQLVRVIGEGGMGRVYEAMDPIIGRRVAVKTIALNFATDPETRARFFREAQAAGQLSHPNLITIHDIGEQKNMPYIVMEYLEGMDLSRAIQQQLLSYDRKMQIMVDVCEGLAFAHAHEIVHRDIKPANIFLTNQGRVKILDFGLARGSMSDVTRTGKLVGTPNYMAPEQIRGDDIDHRADIFSTGVVFYELLSGRKAFEGESIATTMYKVLETQPEPVHLIDAQLPATLSQIIDRALTKDRSARFQSSSEMLDAIVEAHGRTSLAERSRLQTIPLPRPAKGPAKPTSMRAAARSRRPAPMVWIGAAAVAVAAIAGFAVWSQRSSAPEPSTPSTRAEPAPPPPAAPAENPAPSAAAPVPAAPPPSQATSTAPPVTSARSNPADASPAKTPVKKPELPQAAPPSRSALPAATTSVPAPAPAPEIKVEPAAPLPAATAPPPLQPVPAPVVPPRPAVTPPAATATPPPAAPPPARAEESPEAAIQGVLARYRSALEARDIGALKRVWPTLSGRQEDAIANEFQHARAIAASLDGVDIRTTGSGATVTCRRNYAVTTGDGQTLKTTTTMIMTLARRDGGWNIETIRHEVIR
jgi:eukaryotic-like serine/threonine-protein kinase